MSGMTLIVRRITQLMAPSIFLLGIYVILHGHLTPGGGFAGGVLIAGCFVLIVLAYGSDEVKSEARKWRATFSESFGIFLFWFLAVLGLIQGTYFFTNFIAKTSPGQPYHLFSAGIIPLCNIAIGIEVGAALFAIFITLVVLKVGEKL
ncbi:MAG: MnhB domain-containing protein [bacterium]